MKQLALKAKEESTYVITLSFYDEDGTAVIPTAVTWTLTDLDGNVINSRDGETETPAATVNILLRGDDLALTTTGNTRVVTIEATYNSDLGNGLPLNDEVRFDIEPLTNI